MIVVSAEIWPHGDPEGAFEIAKIIAWNEGGSQGCSSYAGSITQTGSAAIGVKSWEQRFTLHGHDRADGPWQLVAAILSAIEPKVRS